MGPLERKFSAGELRGQHPQRPSGPGVAGQPAATEFEDYFTFTSKPLMI